LTVPSPEPGLPLVIAIQAAWLTAVQPQPALVETVKVPVPPALLNAWPEGLIEATQRPPPVPCVTVTAVPAAVIVAERGAPMFPGTVRVTVAGPQPDIAEAVIQAGRPVMLQAQPGVACIVRVRVPPYTGGVHALGVAETAHEGVSVRTAFSIEK
jgi:hypothetical protein